MKRTLTTVASLCLFAACSSSSSDKGSPTGTTTATSTATNANASKIDMFSWWIAPGEADALQSLIDNNKAAHPKVTVYNEGSNTKEDERAVLASRLSPEKYNPPDIYQDNAQTYRSTYATNPARFSQTDAIIDAAGLRAAMFPEMLSDITINGHQYAMPVNVHRSHTMYYNIAVFNAAGVPLPPAAGYATVDDFFAACAALKAKNVTPVAIGNEGWIVRMAFNEFLVGRMGPQRFHDYMMGAGGDDPALDKALADLDTLLTNYTNNVTQKDADGGVVDVSWTAAADILHSGQAAMYLHGNWVTGYLKTADNWQPGVDFGAVSSPGAQGFFAYDLDTFVMPTGGPNPTDTADFLATVGSTKAQADFAQHKGSSPVRNDVPDMADPVAQSAYNDLKNASLRMLMPTRDEWDAALAQFVIDHDKAALKQAYITYPPQH